MPKLPKSIKFKTALVRSSTGSGWHFLLVDKATVAKFEFADTYKRVVCSMNGDEGFQCALLPWGEMFYIIVNKQKRDAVGIVEGDIVNVELTKDESKYGLPVPEELLEVLNQDDEGERLFHALTPGKQRSLIYIVGNIKNIDKRIHTALIIIEHLKKNDGKIVGDKLNEEMKRPAAW